MRKASVYNQIGNVNKKIVELEKQDSGDGEDLDIIVVQEGINSLRSAIDYIANDIYEFINGKSSKNVFVPYSNDPVTFEVRFQSGKLKKLKKDNRELYNCIVDLQEFETDIGGLSEMCELGNAMKHDDLLKQGDIHVTEYEQSNGMTLVVENKIKSENQKFLMLSSDNEVFVENSYNRKYLMDGKYNNDIIDMLTISEDNVRQFADKVYDIID